MNLETRMLSSTDFLNSVPKCVFSPCSPTLTDLKKSLIKAVEQDNKDQLIVLSKHLFNYDDTALQTMTSTLSSLLHLCCDRDSINCATLLLNGELGGLVAPVNEVNNVTGLLPIHVAAKSHAARCLELLLKKRARTDVKSKDGRGLLALELCLASSRMDVIWNPDEYSTQDLVIMLSEKDLTTVKLLSEKTKEIGEVAYASAVGGRIVELAALLIVAAEKVNESILVLHDAESGSKEKTTIYESVILQALLLGRNTTPLRAVKRNCVPTKSESAEKRKLLLCEIELLQLFGTVANRSCTEKKETSPLIRAVQAGDEAVVELILRSNIDVNDADANGDTALHFSLKTSMGSCQYVQQNRIVELLLQHGARVGQRNKLGLTALHIAAANGSSQALELFLSEDPECLHSKTVMKETPLFYAAKNDHIKCAELLLSRGADSEVLNLRERPIDLAKSQEMRFLLNGANICHMNLALALQQKHSACLEADEVSGTCEALLSMTDEGTNFERNRICSSMKAKVCKYFESPSGCVRGEKCFYAHGEKELRKMKAEADSTLSPSVEEIKRKIFVVGLPLSLNSDLLGEYFEKHFGSVEDALIMRVQSGKQIHSRGFGYVTFVSEESVSAAVQKRYVNIMGRQVEIKRVIPKCILLAESEKQSVQQQEQDHNEQSQRQAPMPGHESNTEKMSTRKLKEETPGSKIREEMPGREGTEEITTKREQTSWADKLQHGLPKTCASACQAHGTLSEDKNTPKWVRNLKKWLPRFLKHVYKHLDEGEYALSSLKADFKAAFGMELDHASLGYSKLSDFMRTFPDICRVKAGSMGSNGSPNHMVLLPSLPKPKSKILKTLTMQCSSFPATPIADSGNSDSNDESPLDLLSEIREYAGFINSTAEGNASHEVAPTDATQKDKSSAQQDTSPGVHPRFLEFLKPGTFSITQTPTNDGGDGDRRDLNNGGTGLEGSKIIKPKQSRHWVLEWLARKKNNSSLFFLREFDFYENYEASLRRGRCFGCNQRKMMWGNLTCKHLLWCGDCKKEAERVGARFEHKCVLCDTEVKNIILVLPNIHAQPVYRNLPSFEEFPPLNPSDHRRM